MILARVTSLVKAAGSMAQQMRADIRREIKLDGSVVTEGDRAIERFLRKELMELLPGTAVWGEEDGYSAPGQNGLWIVDPIDGTSNYSFGSPLWGVSVGLLQESRLSLGVVALPDLGETYAAAAGHGATFNGEPLAQIRPGRIESQDPVSFFGKLLLKYPGVGWPGRMRYSGAFVVDAMFVAQGRLRGMIDYKCKLYDIAASVCICREVGADVRYVGGRQFDESELLGENRIEEPLLIFPRSSGFFATL